ncbi:MAG: HlyD family efflux transporter periplasmic adaptor subunit, partial [Muribaculaceae bacterium]|nr:HlyD family efflux transporter periplasmic adaptor subunit [Muribaculaceae bacterium]
RKVDAGTRVQIIQAAYQLWQQAKAAVEITVKTYDRMQSLYSKGVVSEQKRDEAKAAYDAAVAAATAAESQYSLARQGAQREDKESASAMVGVAQGGVAEVNALLDDQYLTAPCDGQVDIIYPHVGELVSIGAPVMNILRTDDKWVTFNVREELLADLTMGKTIKVMIPALDRKEIDATIYYIQDMGTYATWRATKSTGDWDSRTFQIKARPVDNIPDLRPGMTAIIK